MKKLAAAIIIASLLLTSFVLLGVPSLAGTPDDSYTIERYYNEAVNQQSTTSTTPVDAVTLTFTPPATNDFLIIASALTNNSSTSYSTVVELVIDGTTYSETYHKPVDASLNWRSFGAHKVVSLDNTAHTVKIQYRTENAAGTAYIKWATIAALEVTNYYDAVQETEISTTSASYVDAVTLTFTPPAQADYLMLVTANVKTGTSGKSAYAQWTIDGTADPDSEFEQPGTPYMSWGHIEQENLTAASHTFKIQYHTENPATAYIKSARITAVLLTDLGDKQYQESEAESGTQSTTYVDKTTLTFTPGTRSDYLIIASGLGRQENASYAFFANLDVDGASYGEYIFVPGSEKHYRSFMMLRKENLTVASHTFKIQWRTNNASPSSEAFIKNANLIAVKINTLESYNDSGHTTVDNDFGIGETTGYIWGGGFQASTSYWVGWYDGNDAIVLTDGVSATAEGDLSSSCYYPTYQETATAGWWHAVVYDNLANVPSTYTASDANSTTEDSFYVAGEAIPELPTIFAAVAVAGGCFAIYLLMRKRMSCVKA